MKVKIKTFASLKEICGFTEKEFIVSDGITVSEIVKELCGSHAGLEKRRESLLFAVNEEYCRADTILADNDVLAIFPPVSGG
jgi:molybdopterin synthase sulfur carrier subunit